MRRSVGAARRGWAAGGRSDGDGWRRGGEVGEGEGVRWTGRSGRNASSTWRSPAPVPLPSSSNKRLTIGSIYSWKPTVLESKRGSSAAVLTGRRGAAQAAQLEQERREIAANQRIAECAEEFSVSSITN